MGNGNSRASQAKLQNETSLPSTAVGPRQSIDMLRLPPTNLSIRPYNPFRPKSRGPRSRRRVIHRSRAWRVQPKTPRGRRHSSIFSQFWRLRFTSDRHRAFQPLVPNSRNWGNRAKHKTLHAAYVKHKLRLSRLVDVSHKLTRVAGTIATQNKPDTVYALWAFNWLEET